MRRLFIFLLVVASTVRAETVIFCDYADGSTCPDVGGPLVDPDGNAYTTALAAGDCTIVIANGTSANCSTLPATTASNGRYYFTPTNAEVTGDVISVAIVDQTVPAAFLPKFIRIETTSNASAKFPDEAVDLTQAALDAIESNLVNGADLPTSGGGGGSTGYVRITQ